MQKQPAERDESATVVALITGAVPERADEIASLWTKYAPVVEVAPSRTGTTMEADKENIRFDVKTTEVFWLVGFCAWRSIETYSPAVVLGPLAQVTLDQFLSRDGPLPQFEIDYKGRLAMARSIIEGKDTDFSKWPPDVPRPQADRERLSDQQERVAFDLVALSLATALLHEFRHVMFLQDGNKPSTLPEEEIACDVWARSFLTDKLAGYAKSQGHEYQAVLTKRAKGMARTECCRPPCHHAVACALGKRPVSSACRAHRRAYRKHRSSGGILFLDIHGRPSDRVDASSSPADGFHAAQPAPHRRRASCAPQLSPDVGVGSFRRASRYEAVAVWRMSADRALRRALPRHDRHFAMTQIVQAAVHLSRKAFNPPTVSKMRFGFDALRAAVLAMP